jgi:hypothetical protein
LLIKKSLKPSEYAQGCCRSVMATERVAAVAALVAGLDHAGVMEDGVVIHKV